MLEKLRSVPLNRDRRQTKHDNEKVLTKMGYSLYITRADSWHNAKDNPITEQEWLALIAQDPSLSLNEKDFCDVRIEGGGTKRINPVEWSAANDGNCLWWYQGAIECKNPTQAWQSKMLELAKLLGGKVIGDGGEEYT